MYGIPNCDTLKKARKWLEQKGLEYTFHDYKKAGAQKDILARSLDEFGAKVVVNKRGTTYRQIDDATKTAISSDALTKDELMSLLSENPSMIKRPIIEHNDKLIIGFKDDQYEEFFS